MLHARTLTAQKGRIAVKCDCGHVQIEAPAAILRRLADRVDVRLRCHHCAARLVWHEGERPTFAKESEVGT